MENFFNSTDTIVSDALKGFCTAHKNIVCLHENPTVVTRAHPSKDKVGIISGGGSGHEPLHIGFVGYGMLDAACPGQLLTSPTPQQIAKSMQEADQGKGVLAIVKSYHGDRMNFSLASKLVETKVEMALVSDDCAFDDPNMTRGLAGTLVIEKIVGAAAESHKSLQELKRLAEEINERTKTIGVALSAPTLPPGFEPMYSLPKDKIEYGVGIHGEIGMERIDAMQARPLASKIISQLLSRIKEKDTELLLFVNGLGATPLIDLYIIYEAAAKYLEEKGYRVARSLVGNYVTSLNSHGCSITITALNPEYIEYWDAPVNTPCLNW